MLYCRADAVLEYSNHVVILPVMRVMAERKGEVFVDERTIIVRWVWGASEQEGGAHFTCRLADGNLERIRRLFSNL